MNNNTLRIILALSILIMSIAFTGCDSDQATVDLPGDTLIPTEPTTEVIDEPVPGEISDDTEIGLPEPTEEGTAQVDAYTDVDPVGQVVTFWHPFTGIQEAALMDIIGDFNATNQWGISLTAEYQGSYGDLQDKMLTFMNTRDAPALLVTRDDQAATYQLGGGLIDLNPLVDHDTWGLTNDDKDDFFPGIFDQGIFPSFGGIRLSLPIYGRMNVLYYNTDWLAELGYSTPPNTPDIFKEAACGAMGQPFSSATAASRTGFRVNIHPTSFADWVFAFGGKLFYQGEEKYNFDNGVTTAAMTFLQDMVNQGCATAVPSPEGDQIDFSRGVLLFAVDSTDRIPDFRKSVQSEANFNWRIAPLPNAANNPAANVTGANLSIPKTTLKAQLAAWLFIRYFTNPETQAKWVQATDSLPVRQATVNYLGDYFTNSSAYQMSIEILMRSTHEPSVPGYALVRELNQAALQDILDGANVEPTLNQLTTDANLILEEQLALIPESPDPWAEINPSGQTITFWHQHSEDRQAVLDEIINEFNATNKWGITVIPESQAGYGDIFLNLLPVLGTEDAPNLIMAYQYQAAAYYTADGLVDMSSLVESTKWGLTSQEKEDFYTSIYAQDIYPIFDGARLGFPVQRSTDVLYYNADWLAELGFDEPPANPTEFKQMACAATAQSFSKSVANSSMGYYFYLDAGRFLSWVYAFGGNIFDQNSNQFVYNSEEAIAATDFLLDLIESGCAAPILERDEAQTDFGKGSLLFMLDSSFHIPAMSEIIQEGADFEWVTAPVPSTGDGPVQRLFGASISMPTNTPEAQLASWLFIQYLTTPEAQARWGQGSGYLPVRISAADHLSNFFAENPNYANAFEFLYYGVFEPSVPGYDFINQEVELALEAIIGGADVIETLNSLTTTTNQILATHLER